MKLEHPDNCTRHKVALAGEVFYVVVGEDFALVTGAADNRLEVSAARCVVEALCMGFDRLLGGDHC